MANRHTRIAYQYLHRGGIRSCHDRTILQQPIDTSADKKFFSGLSTSGSYPFIQHNSALLQHHSSDCFPRHRRLDVAAIISENVIDRCQRCLSISPYRQLHSRRHSLRSYFSHCQTHTFHCLTAYDGTVDHRLSLIRTESGGIHILSHWGALVAIVCLQDPENITDGQNSPAICSREQTIERQPCAFH